MGSFDSALFEGSAQDDKRAALFAPSAQDDEGAGRFAPSAQDDKRAAPFAPSAQDDKAPHVRARYQLPNTKRWMSWFSITTKNPRNSAIPASDR